MGDIYGRFIGYISNTLDRSLACTRKKGKGIIWER